MGKFLEKYFSTLMQEETENLNSPITIAWIELISNHPMNINLGPDGYTGVF